MELLKFDSYDDVVPLWQELNSTYKSGELTLDWATHKIMWDNFYAPRGYRLMILVGVHRGKCVGIFPFLSEGTTEAPTWMLCEDFIIGREYFCPPAKIHLFRSHLPEHISEDMSCFYTPRWSKFFYRSPGGIVDLKESPEAYFSSLGKKARGNLNRVLRDNTDIQVKTDTALHWEDIQGVLRSQLDYWLKKKGFSSEDEYDYSRDKIHTDLKLMQRAQEMGKLIALYFYLDNRLVAANFAVRRELDRIDDYLCLRNCSEEFTPRSLGILAILKNIEHCRSLGIRYYDLSACMSDYKKRFINTDLFYYYLPSPCTPTPQDISTTTWISQLSTGESITGTVGVN